MAPEAGPTLDGNFPSDEPRAGCSENRPIIRPLPLCCFYRCPGPDKYSPPPCFPRRTPSFPPPPPPMSLLDHPERDAVYRTPSISEAPSWSARFTYTGRIVAKHITKHVGVGIICSVAYFDP